MKKKKHKRNKKLFFQIVKGLKQALLHDEGKVKLRTDYVEINEKGEVKHEKMQSHCRIY